MIRRPPRATLPDSLFPSPTLFRSVSGRCLGDADGLADERLADEDEIAAPPDLAIGAHTPHGMLGVVGQRLDALGPAARARRVSAGRRLLAQRLVRPDFVVLLPEAVEAPLLGGKRAGRRFGGVALERPVHAFMPAVLLGR